MKTLRQAVNDRLTPEQKERKMRQLLIDGMKPQPRAPLPEQLKEMQGLRPSWENEEVRSADKALLWERWRQLGITEQAIKNATPAQINQGLDELETDIHRHRVNTAAERAELSAQRKVHGANPGRDVVLNEFVKELWGNQ